MKGKREWEMKERMEGMKRYEKLMEGWKERDGGIKVRNESLE